MNQVLQAIGAFPVPYAFGLDPAVPPAVEPAVPPLGTVHHPVRVPVYGCVRRLGLIFFKDAWGVIVPSPTSIGVRGTGAEVLAVGFMQMRSTAAVTPSGSTPILARCSRYLWYAVPSPRGDPERT